LRDLERSLGRPAGEVLVVTADITQQSNQIRLIEQAVAHFGGLDVLVNNAGVASWGHFAESTEAILRQVMEVNFFAPAELIRLAIPVLVKGEQPAIVNIASMCGRRAMPAWTEYSASKYALCGLTEALRGELARFGIDILLIVPGLTASEFSEHFLRSDGRAQIDFGAGMAPETLARRVVHSLKKNRTESIIGRDARWILLVNKFFPWLVDYLLARKVQKLYA
jgi:short-subunit dehydrogenase